MQPSWGYFRKLKIPSEQTQQRKTEGNNTLINNNFEKKSQNFGSFRSLVTFFADIDMEKMFRGFTLFYSQTKKRDKAKKR